MLNHRSSLKIITLIVASLIASRCGSMTSSSKTSSPSQALANGCDLKKFQPSFISATGGDSQVVLKWQPNGDTVPIKGYYMRYWEGGDFRNSPPNPPNGAMGNGVPLGYYPPNQELITDTTATVSGLQNGKTYTFGVTAYEPYRCGYGWETYISATTKAH